MFYFLCTTLHSTHMPTMRPEIITDDNIPHSLHRSKVQIPQSLHSLHRSKDQIPQSPHSLDRSKVHIPKSLHSLHRSKVHIPQSLNRNMDILHSKHVCRLDDNPGGRADGRVHNSTVH